MTGKQGSPKSSSDIWLKAARLLPGGLACFSLAVFLWLACLPKDPDSAVFFGYSASRLALMAVPFSAFAALLTGMILFGKNDSFRERCARCCARKPLRLGLLAAALAAFLAGWHALIFFHFLADFNPFLKARLLPLTVWLLASGLLLLAGLPRLVSAPAPRMRKVPAWRLFLISFLTLLVFWLLASRCGLGSAAESTTVSDLGVPLLEWQIAYVCGLLAAGVLCWMNLAAMRVSLSLKARYSLDLVIFLLIWFLAALLWLRQPLPENNYFAPTQLPPNYETYPFSDAQRYSLDALQLLRGDTRAEIVSKPMFVQYLAGLHWLGGLDYERLVYFQTLILALFPALLYLIGRRLNSRLLGLGAALFAILREINFIQASDIANVSNSKLLMTDFPYTLGIALLVCVTIRWLQQERERVLTLILIGGLLALNCLLRPQSLILLPLYALLALLRHWRRKGWKQALFSFGVILLVLLLTILPLLARNYAVGRYFWFDAPDYMNKFASSYALSDIGEMEEAGETAAGGSQFAGSLLSALGAADSKLLTGIANNFFRNLLSAFLQFPLRFNASVPLQDLTGIRANFWAELGDYRHPLNDLLACLNALLFALGIARLWRRGARVLLALLGFFTCISLSSALFRFSGWRFIMPVDWIFYLFYLEGFIFLCQMAAGRVGWPAPAEAIARGNGKLTWSAGRRLPEALLALLFIFIGALIPIREAFIKDSAPETRDALCGQLADLLDEETSPLTETELREMCLSEDSFVNSGELLYPRYFRAGYGYAARPNLYYGTLDYARMSFYILDGITSRYYIPLEDPDGLGDYRNGSRIILLSRLELLPEMQVMAVIGAPGSVRFSASFGQASPTAQ